MHPEDLHITLKFLGEADEGTVTALIKKVSQLSLPKSFIIELGMIGFFGKYDQPRVLWVDVKERNELLHLQTEIEAVLYTMGFEKEKRDYRPHMTLAKKWKGVSALSDNMRRTLQEKYSLEQQFSVQEIILFRIHPNKVPSYEEVAKFPL
jgi:2'-5' RNA ligase